MGVFFKRVTNGAEQEWVDGPPTDGSKSHTLNHHYLRTSSEKRLHFISRTLSENSSTS